MDSSVKFLFTRNLTDNINRVQGIFVFKPRNRWLINVVLVLAVVGLIGVSIAPLISIAFKENQPSTIATPLSPGQNAGSEQLSKLQEQARGYELVLQREPENQTALQGLLQARLALLQLGQGDINGITEPLEKLVKLNPEQTQYTILLAQAKQQTGDREGAAAAYRSVLDTKPGDINALKGLTILSLQQNQPEVAITLLQNTISKANQTNKTQPGSVDVAAVGLLLADVYATQKRYDEAIAIYDRAINADKQDFRPVLAKALVLKQQGKTEQAKPLFESAAALAPAQYKDQINQIASGQPADSNTSPIPGK